MDLKKVMDPIIPTSGFGNSRLLAGENVWVRGGSWKYVGDSFCEELGFDEGHSVNLEQFEVELNRITRLSEQVRQEHRRNLDVWNYETLKQRPNWSPNFNELLSKHLGFSSELFEELETFISAEVYERQQRPKQTFKTVANFTKENTYMPLRDEPDAWLEFASIAEDLWEDEEGCSEQSRILKFQEFCVRYGPPIASSGYDFDVGFWQITEPESLARRLSTNRINAIISFCISGQLPLVVRTNFQTNMLEARFFAVAVRCFQMLGSNKHDWMRNQPALKRFFKSDEATKMFDEKARWGASLSPWEMEWSKREEFRNDPDSFLDSREFWRGYLPHILNLGASGHYGQTRDIKYDLESDDYVESFQFSSLMSMMWHQLRQAVLSRRLIKRCAREACGKIFEVRKRSDQIYCNDTHEGGGSRCKSLTTSEKNYTKYKKRGAQTITPEKS